MARANQLPPNADRLQRGDFVRLCYRLGQSQATGVLTIFLDDGDAVLLVLRRGQLFRPASDLLGRETTLRLERLSALPSLAHFEGGLAAYPPSVGRPFCLATWARRHLESQIDSVAAQELVGMLAGARLMVVSDKLPHSKTLDDTDRRIIAAMQKPQRLDQIWPLARTPRFRLLTFIHFLKSVGALHAEGVVAEASPTLHRPPREAVDDDPRRALGVSASANRDDVKRAYRRLARALHPDLQASCPPDRRRQLERELARINRAYRELLAQV